MSRTSDLDQTIASLNKMLEAKKEGEEEVSTKEKLQITDRLLRAYALKYKHSDEGKGGKFAPQPSGHDNGS